MYQFRKVFVALLFCRYFLLVVINTATLLNIRLTRVVQLCMHPSIVSNYNICQFDVRTNFRCCTYKYTTIGECANSLIIVQHSNTQNHMRCIFVLQLCDILTQIEWVLNEHFLPHIVRRSMR